MAEVMLCFGRGACDFAPKPCSRNLLASRNKRRVAAADASRVAAGPRLGGSQHGDLCGGGKAADTVTAGLSLDPHTPTTARGAGGGRCDVRNVTCHSYFGFKEYSPSGQTRVTVQRKAFARTLRTSAGRCLFWGRAVSVRAYSANESRSEPLYKTKTGYYEVLEVPSAATHAQIKTAYYKQSFVYHPDRNAGSDQATTRFSEISEAYAVLGNKALRKKYDRGLLSAADLTATARPSARDAAAGAAGQQPQSRRPVAGGDVGGSVFDFDRFYKSHYSEQLQRQRDVRVRKEEMMKSKREAVGERTPGRMLEIGVAMLLAMGMAILLSLKRAS